MPEMPIYTLNQKFDKNIDFSIHRYANFSGEDPIDPLKEIKRLANSSDLSDQEEAGKKRWN